MTFVDDRHCDWRGNCKRKPYADVFHLKSKPEKEQFCPMDKWDFVGGWSYLCFWHFQYARLRSKVRRLFGSKEALGWGKAETTKEYLDRLAEEAVWEAEYEADEQTRLAAETDAMAEAEETARTEQYRDEEYWDGGEQ